ELALDFEGRGEFAALDAERLGDDFEAFDLLEIGKMRGGPFDFGAEQFLDFRAGDQRGEIGGRQLLRSGPVEQFVESGNEDRHDGGLLVAEQHGLLDIRTVLQQRLDRLRRDFFPVRQDENVLLAVGDLEVAVRRQFADVARMEPTLGIYSFCGRVRLVPVAFHTTGAAHQDLAVLRELEFDAGQQRADRADALLAGPVDGDNAGFGEAVAFQQVYADAEEEGRGHRVEWRAAGDEIAQASAGHFLADFGEDQLFRQSALQSQKQADGMPFGFAPRALHADFQRPLHFFARTLRHLRDAVSGFLGHVFVEARHAEHG